MQSFSQVRHVTDDDLDGMGHVNNVRYVAWIQEISEQHWKEKAPVQIQEEVAWVVYNHNITYHLPALPGDSIRLVTYIQRSEGVFSYRSVKMYREKDDKLLVDAMTTWCMLDVQTLRPKRISKAIRACFGDQG